MLFSDERLPSRVRVRVGVSGAAELGALLGELGISERTELAIDTFDIDVGNGVARSVARDLGGVGGGIPSGGESEYDRVAPLRGCCAPYGCAAYGCVGSASDPRLWDRVCCCAACIACIRCTASAVPGGGYPTAAPGAVGVYAACALSDTLGAVRGSTGAESCRFHGRDRGGGCTTRCVENSDASGTFTRPGCILSPPSAA